MINKVTPEDIIKYRKTAQENWKKTEPERQLRKEKAWILAKQAANLLKEQFKVSKVVVFGSLIRENCFTFWSDIDLAAWGLSPLDTFRAMEAVKDLDQDIEINLVDIETCGKNLKLNIEKDGIIL
ncbi:MAG: nucleotidyltransferase domain-containing protein [Crocosphaera sp.]|nr:nucleotidyltransferase domain-containing protein [Crocosphaera sp.]